MPCEVNCDKGGGSRRDSDEGRGVGILKGEELGFVVDEIEGPDGVVGGGEESVPCEEGISLGVGGLQQIGYIWVTVEYHCAIIIPASLYYKHITSARAGAQSAVSFPQAPSLHSKLT